MKTLQKLICVGVGIISLSCITCLDNEGKYQGDPDYAPKKIYLSKEDFKEDGNKEWGLVIEQPGEYRKMYYLK
jgi:hypothetical protein